MKKNIGYTIGLFAALLALAGCEQQDTELYTDDPCVYFIRGERGTGQQDSILHSFFLVPEGQDRDTVLVEVATMGFPVKGQARPIRIVQTNVGKPGAAIPGKHYVAFDDPSVADQIVVTPGSVLVKIPVILLRDPSLEKEKVRIEMTIAENDYFKPGIDDNRNFMVKTTAMAEKPVTWEASWKYYFGVWGTRKMWFVVNRLGYSEFDEVPDHGYQDYLQLKAHERLALDNANSEEPLCENPDKKHALGEVCADCVVFP